MLYTSGTTGRPKGVMHTHYDIVQQHITAKWILDIHQDDVYWCTADPGWVTGIAYGILGPFSNGATSIVDAARFSAEHWYKIINDYKVTVWYTAPTAIRMMMKEGFDIAKKYDLSSLRHLASVGEPLNPEAIWWGVENLKLAFHDNWWQTETGGILIANYPCMDIKVGSMGRPFPGVVAEIVDDNGNPLPPNKEGNLAIRPGWPSMMLEIWNNKEKYDSYFKNGWYFSGDRAWKDADGYFWFVGRADDVIKTAGHRVGPFEVESALIEHPAVAEAGVIGKPDELYGEIIKAFIALKKGFKPSEELKKEIQTFIKTRLAGHAYPKEIEFRDTLPKTRSGKIMRRVLKAQELGLPVGDLSTMED
jgi:acetyl-CoA synthetase